MSQTGGHSANQAEFSKGCQKYAEGRRGGKGDRSPAHDVPTPSRGGRTGERREKPCTALEEIMRKRGIDDAWAALEEAQQQGVTTDKYTVSRMLMKTVGDGRNRLNTSRVYRAIGLVEKFIDIQPNDVDEVLLNALLDTCCKLKDLPRLESIMQRMRDLQITPSPVTLGILVKTYGKAGDIQKVLQVWDEMEAQRGQANAVTFGCMIDACVKCNRLDKAVEIFRGMRAEGKHRNTILYTTLIKGYGLDKDLNSALELFREMPRENVPYNTITYNSIIDCCVKCGDLATAESLLHEVTSPNSSLQPDLITFSTLLKGYCHAGELDKGLQLVEAIKSRGLRCDELVYNTIMDGCVKANDVSAGVGLFEEMVKSDLCPSAITHSILVRLYQRAGYEDDASEAVAQLYAHHGIERPTGGDRGRSNVNRNANHRSPGGRGHFHGAAPTASPMSAYYNQDHNNNYWNAWGEPGYDAYSQASSVSTPCGSPMHHTGGHHQGNGLYLPMDAMQAMPPPLPGMAMPPPFPGMGGGDMQYGGSCTPMGSAHGSLSGSPCMSPTGMDQQQGQGAMMGFPASPAQVPCHGPLMAPSSTGLPAMPPWPFAGAQSQGVCNGANFAQGSAAGSPVMGNMMTPLSSGMSNMQQAGGSTPGGANQCWPGQSCVPQQSPFPAPLSSPHNLAQSCPPSHSQSCPPSQHPQAFFDMMPGTGQGCNGPEAGISTQNPFCF